ncbi:Rubredoxin-2 domain-containing protein [Sulfidibacter corallicola]|uniref:LapB rubredoxin metal binding domain-containing protein n=1 Tax=Sulfidibacter corallicola TaxID=2818388 RepID=A0A8A4TRL9_SULCO|nr:hypothetical protein [Sulfidibacter corallicola]QTD52606.1 hypothetical protein J3U87_09040 [Sulfidibacter corallicola]
MTTVWVILAAILLTLGVIALLAWLGRGTEQESRELLLARTMGRLFEGDTEQALEDLRALYRRSGQDAGIGLALGVLFRRSGKIRMALRTHLGLNTRPNLDDPMRALILTELGADYLESGLLERARQSLEEAQALAGPTEHLARYGQRTYARLGEWDQAQKLVAAYGKRAGVDVKQRMAMLRNEQGESEWREQRLDEADTAFRKALSLWSGCLPAILNHCRYLRHVEKAAKALTFLNKQRKHFEGHEWLYHKEAMKIAMALEDHQVFVEPAKTRLQEDPDDWRTRAVLGSFLLETGAFEEAGNYLREALEISPQTLLLHQKMWDLILRVDDLDRFRVYREFVRHSVRFSDPYECRACGFHSAKLLWQCPSCFQDGGFVERKI